MVCYVGRLDPALVSASIAVGALCILASLVPILAFLIHDQAHGTPTRDEAATLARLATELLEADSESSTMTLRAPHGRPTGQATEVE